MIRVSNSLDQDQAQQNVWPELGPNCLQKLSIGPDLGPNYLQIGGTETKVHVFS